MVDEFNIEYTIGKILVDNHLTLSTAESCTGGLLAGKFINYPGISSVFMEGAVTYSNEAKIRALNVKKETLDTYGAVSEETAREMATGIAKVSSTNIGISTTGIAGPGGGTPHKPVGLVYVSIYFNGEIKVKRLNLSGSRQEIRNSVVDYVMNWLLMELKQIN